MKNLFKLLIVLVVAVACGDDKSSPSNVQYAGDALGLFTEGRMSGVEIYYDALVKTGLDSRLSEETGRTYLVPDNNAMQTALESGGFSTVAEADVDFLSTLINNHTFTGILVEDDITKTVLTAESGAQVYVSTASGIVFNGLATVSDANNFATNGVVHIIDFPILDFPADNIATIVDAVANDATAPEFTILNAALASTGLDASLNGTSEFTVFAPTDAAFAAAGFADFATLDAAFTAEELTALLSNHVISGRFLSMDLASGRAYTINGGAGDAKGVDVDASATAVSVETRNGGAATVDSLNVLATNGIIHVVDAVIRTEGYLYEALGGTVGVDDPNGISGFFATFFAAMDASTFDYEGLLSTEDEYSILVPSAYAGGSTQAELDQYIFEGAISLEDNIGSKVVTIGDGEYWVGGAEAIDSDAVVIYGESGSSLAAGLCGGDACMQDESAYNGNITFLGGTGLTPLPEMSTTSVVAADMDADSLSLYVASLILTDTDSLTGVTYLAVDNTILESVIRDAMDEAGVVDQDTLTTIAELIENIDAADEATVAAVIDRHIVTSVFFALDLVADTQLSTRDGGTIDIVTVDSGTETAFGILVNDDGEISTINFTNGDITGYNGALHVIDAAIPE